MTQLEDKVKGEVEKIINRRKDRVRYYRICANCQDKLEIHGWGEVTEEEEFVLI